MEFKEHIIAGITKIMKDEKLAQELSEELGNIDKVFENLQNTINRIHRLEEESNSGEGLKHLICMSSVIERIKDWDNHFDEMEGTPALILIGEYMRDYFESRINGQIL